MGRVANNQQTVGDQSYSLSYGYNLGGALTNQTYPSNRVVSYAFDDAARLAQVSSGSTVYANQFDYSSAQGLLKSVTMGNGAVESYGYNSRLQLSTLTLAKDSSVLQKYEYKYGVVQSDGSVDETKNTGQIGRIESWIGAGKQWQQRFSYDSLARLSSASEFRGDNAQQSYLVNYDYDVFGNRYQKQSRNGGNPFSQIWTEDSDITQSTNRFATNVSYDNAGNVLTDQKFRQLKFQYDANNRQKQSSNLDDSGVVKSVYDAGGQRVATQVSGALTNVLVYDAAGKLLAEYGSTAPGGTQYLFSDHQGSPRTITSSNGSIVSRHDYLPFGEELGLVGMRNSGQGYPGVDGTRQKYAGMETDDATGLDHTLWRQYDSSSGRWTSPDPYGGSMSVASPQSFNRYSYVENDPVNGIDPTGLQLSDAGVYVVSNYSEQVQLEKALKYDQQIAVNASYVAKHGGSVSYDESGHATFRSKYSSNFAGNAARNMAAKKTGDFFAGLGLQQNPGSQEDFDKNPEYYHELLVSYTNTLVNTIPGSTVQWRRDGKIQYIDFPETYEDTVSQLEKAGYFTGLKNWAWNPLDHPGGKEFRDPLSVECELSFHFVVLYPQIVLAETGGNIKGDPTLRPERLQGPTRAVDIHIDRASPIHPGTLMPHARDFWRGLERRFGFK